METTQEVQMDSQTKREKNNQNHNAPEKASNNVIFQQNEFILSYKCLKCDTSHCNEKEFLLHYATHVVKTEQNPQVRNNVSAPKMDQKTKYKCNHCTEEFAWEMSLTYHERNHFSSKVQPTSSSKAKTRNQTLPRVESKIYTCKKCCRRYRSRQYYLYHTMTHLREDGTDFPTSKPPILLNLLPKPLKTMTRKSQKAERNSEPKSTLAEPAATNANEQMHKCTDCGKHFYNKNSLSSHVLVHSKKRHFSCTKCSTRFKYKNHLVEHVLSHLGVKPYICTECKVQFRQKVSLIRHLEVVGHSSIRGEIKEYTCTYCPKKISGKTKFVDHSLEHLSTEEKVNNPVIKRHYTKSVPKKIMELLKPKVPEDPVVESKKPFECADCSKRFITKMRLRTHLLVHSDERNYCCRECGKAFKQNGNLKHHMLLHSEEKPLSCPKCQARFKLTGSFTEHILSHLGIKPFECGECKDNFRSRQTLLKHMQDFEHSSTAEEKKEFVCMYCNNTIQRKTKFAMHSLEHWKSETGEVHTLRSCFPINEVKKYYKRGTNVDNVAGNYKINIKNEIMAYGSPMQGESNELEDGEKEECIMRLRKKNEVLISEEGVFFKEEPRPFDMETVDSPDPIAIDSISENVPIRKPVYLLLVQSTKEENSETIVPDLI